MTIYNLSQDEIYSRLVTQMITATTLGESQKRSFGQNAQAYKWTNESLCELENPLHVDLQGKNLLLIACSGDPILTFAYLNAGNQVAFDTSHKAVLWSELKVRAMEQWSWRDFCAFFGLAGAETKKAPSYCALKPSLSEYARDIFDTLFRRYKTGAELMGDECFFRSSGYTSAFSELNIYTTSQAKYNQARQRIRQHTVKLIPASLEKVFTITDEKFGAFYGSNAIDHFKNRAGEFDYSRRNIEPFLLGVNARLEQEATIILQFEWSQEAADTSKEILKELDFTIKKAPGNAGGYGKLYAAQRK